MNYQKLNNIFGWIAFAIASYTYLSTIEPTASFWDCGEYIATAYKLEVGHPPGAPFFLLVARLFSMFGTPETAAYLVNVMSALCSAGAILFLFWTITAFAQKIVTGHNNEPNQGQSFAIIGSGLVGALAFTFSDTFWFSAVEGEVYAMSSFFTAVTIWAITKWDRETDMVHESKWLIFIAFLIGISIGVHLLNLLAIPALVFVYYFKKFQPTNKGLIITGIAAIGVLAFIQNGIIPGVVNLVAQFELIFTNSFGMPFNTGTIVFFLLLIGGLTFGLFYTIKKQKAILHTALLAFTFILIGYSSFFVIIIRSQANPPIDENNPENAITLLAYLMREQYGDHPLLYGQYYNAPLDAQNPYSDGKPVYMRDVEKGKYVISDDRRNTIPNYDKDFKTIFPRMYSSQPNHVAGYKAWGNVKGTPVRKQNFKGETETIYKPTFAENIRFYFNYQIGYMYFRYFMWNFSGRQNDIQGLTGNITDGNWISGIPFIDNPRLGDQSKLPQSLANNKGRNIYYMLPLLLGALGIIYQYKKNKADSLVILLLFLFTGIAINTYLNVLPFQPRERDYAYVGSYYAFAIWIGLGVLFLYEFFSKKIQAHLSAIAATALCLVFVPGIMAKENWDDHDRSGRYTARDFAKNYLDSCAPNAIIFTNGDNDTFPLWYVQEVEGYRTDVRVVNLSLLQTDWYIDQMKRKAYDSEAVPFSLSEEKYRQGTRDYVPIYDRGLPGYVNIREIIDFIANDNPQAKLQMQSGTSINYMPTTKIRIPVDSAKVVSNGTVPAELADKVVPAIEFEINKSYILKNELMILDLLATNNWERPVYFAITTGSDSYLNLEPYFQLEGLAYRLVPVRNFDNNGQTGRVHTGIMFENLMNKFNWGGIENPKVYLDENNLRMTMNFRNIFYRLADALITEGKNDKALEVLDKAMAIMPEATVPFNYFVLPIAEGYYKLKQTEKGNQIATRLREIYTDNLTFYANLESNHIKLNMRDVEQSMQILRQLMFQLQVFEQTDELNKLKEEVKALPPGKSNEYRELYAKYFAII